MVHKGKIIVDTKETFRTPLWIWQELIRQHKYLIRGDVLDPSAGCGSLMAEIIKENKKSHTLCDVRKAEYKQWKLIKLHKVISKDNMVIADFLKHKFNRKYNSIITNPPFSNAIGFIEKSIKLLKKGGYATFLQRLDFLASLKRSKWFQTAPLKYVIVITKRPTWLNIDNEQFKSAASVDYCFYVFKQGYVGSPKVKWLFKVT